MTAPDDPTRLLLQAHVDGELDAASALAFDDRLAAEPELAAERDRLLALRRLLRSSLRQGTASEQLRRAVAGLGVEKPVLDRHDRPRAGRPSSLPARFRSEWGLALAACLVGGLFGSGVTALLRQPSDGAPVIAEVVADHLRAVIAPQPFDVASSDQHTVKPWFTGRLSFAPRVFDLTDAGFTLQGGRVDVLAGQPAATLVFRHGKHLISLTSQPLSGSATSSGTRRDDRGFLVRDWVEGGMHYWAVSDIAPDELDAFEAAARAKTGNAD